MFLATWIEDRLSLAQIPMFAGDLWILLIFATSGMRSRLSSASWYFCICRYCEVRPGFRTGYNAALVHPVFLLVLCPDRNFAYSHMPFPECRFFPLPWHSKLLYVLSLHIHCTLQVMGAVAFAQRKWRGTLPHYAQSLSILKIAWGCSSAEPLRAAWYWINIAHWALCHHSYLDLLF